MLKMLIFVFLWFFSSNSFSSICEKVFLKKRGGINIQRVEDVLGRPLSTSQKAFMRDDSPHIQISDFSIYYTAGQLKNYGFSMYEIDTLIRYLITKDEDQKSALKKFYFAVSQARLMKKVLGQYSMMSDKQMVAMFGLLRKIDYLNTFGESMSVFEDTLRYIEEVVINSPEEVVRSIVSDKGLPLDVLKDLINKFAATLVKPEQVEPLHAYADKRDDAKEELKTFTSETSWGLSSMQRQLEQGRQLQWYRRDGFLEDMEIFLRHDMLSKDPLVKAAIEMYIEEFKEGKEVPSFYYFSKTTNENKNVTLQQVEDVLGRPLSTRQKDVINTSKYADTGNLRYFIPFFTAAGFSMYEIERLIRNFEAKDKKGLLEEFYTVMYQARLMKEALGQQSMMNSQQMKSIFQLNIEMRELNNLEEFQMHHGESVLSHIEKVFESSHEFHMISLKVSSPENLPKLSLDGLSILINKVFVETGMIAPERADLLHEYVLKRDSVKKWLSKFTSKTSKYLAEAQQDLAKGEKFKISLLNVLGGVTFEDMAVLVHHDMLSEDPSVKAAIEMYIEEFKEKRRHNREEEGEKQPPSPSKVVETEWS